LRDSYYKEPEENPEKPGNPETVNGAGQSMRASSLAPFQLSKPASEEKLRTMRQAIWREQGVAVLPPEEIADDIARQAIVDEASRVYRSRLKPSRAGDER